MKSFSSCRLRISLALFTFSILAAESRSHAQTPPSNSETCVPITDCNGDGIDDMNPELTPEYCNNLGDVCIDDGTCKPKVQGYCRIDAECEAPKICDRNICKLPSPGLEDGARPDPLQNAL